MAEMQITADRAENRTEEHILVCLSPSPSNAKIILTAGKMARAYQGKLTALFVETPTFSTMSSQDRERLQSNIQLAKAQGAVLEQVNGEDIPFQIAEYARLNGITKIVVGRSNASVRHIWGRRTLTDQLIASAPNVEIFIIPDHMVNAGYQIRTRKRQNKFSVGDTVKMFLLLFLATVLSLVFYRFGFSDSNIITIYILGVLIASVVTDHITYSILSSILSVIIFNYFFTEPRYTLLAYDIGYPMTFLVMFLASLLTGTLAAKLKDVARQSAEQAYRTKILLDTNQALQQAENADAIWHTTIEQLSKLTGRKIVQHTAKDKTIQNDSGQQAGQEVLYPVHIGDISFGYLGISVQENSMDVFENSIVLSIIGECALALENEKNRREKEQAAILAQNEQLRANLLRTISHDLRTPLTSISGNASNLMTQGDSFSKDTKQQLYADIYDDSMWLVGLVENLLSVTRMVGDGVKLRKNAELLEDVVEEALRHLDRKSVEHTIILENEEEYLMVKIDAKLIIQVIINLINNAIKYTQSGSEICIRIRKKENLAAVSVSDNGPGIPDEKKDKIFELFYSGGNPILDGHRSMGLGLALCKSIITAHGGVIGISDSETGGACFTFTLPVEEVMINE